MINWFCIQFLEDQQEYSKIIRFDYYISATQRKKQNNTWLQKIGRWVYFGYFLAKEMAMEFWGVILKPWRAVMAIDEWMSSSNSTKAMPGFASINRTSLNPGYCLNSNSNIALVVSWGKFSMNRMLFGAAASCAFGLPCRDEACWWYTYNLHESISTLYIKFNFSHSECKQKRVHHSQCELKKKMIKWHCIIVLETLTVLPPFSAVAPFSVADCCPSSPRFFLSAESTDWFQNTTRIWYYKNLIWANIFFNKTKKFSIIYQPPCKYSLPKQPFTILDLVDQVSFKFSQVKEKRNVLNNTLMLLHIAGQRDLQESNAFNQSFLHIWPNKQWPYFNTQNGKLFCNISTHSPNSYAKSVRILSSLKLLLVQVEAMYFQHS